VYDTILFVVLFVCWYNLRRGYLCVYVYSAKQVLLKACGYDKGGQDLRLQ